MLDVVTEILNLVQSLATGIFGYTAHYCLYYICMVLDLFYVPFAGFFNATADLIGVFLDLFEVSLSWAGETFMWFVGILVTIYLFFFIIRLIILLKEIILRWL